MKIFFKNRQVDSGTISTEGIRSLSHPLAFRIAKELLRPSCPIDLAKKLGIHEQKVYYHLKKLLKAGVIQQVSQEQRHGTLARFYQLTHPAFLLLFGKPEPTRRKIARALELRPFISQRKLDCLLIVGSPDPHGPFRARASDACCAIDLALWLGLHSEEALLPNYRLDTQVKPSELKENLILIGGPMVNLITQKVMRKSPVRIELKNGIRIRSDLSGKSYSDEECGVLLTLKNPWNPKKQVLVLAGIRFSGTRGSVLALIQNPDHACAGNRFDPKQAVHVIRGLDLDGDGIIDSAEFLE